MNETAADHFNETNRRYLMAHLRLLEEELRHYQAGLEQEGQPGFEPSTNTLVELQEAADALTVVPPLDRLADNLGLSTFERKILLLCAGVELNTRLGQLVATLQGDPQMVHPSFSLAVAAFADAHWSALAPVSPLRYWKLIDLADGPLIAQSALRIEEHILHYLTGVHYLHPQLRDIVRPLNTGDRIAPSQLSVIEQILQVLSDPDRFGAWPAIRLEGADRSDLHQLAAMVGMETGYYPYVLAAERLPANRSEIASLSLLWNREATLHHYALLLDVTGMDESDKARLSLLRQFIEDMQGIIMIGGPLRIGQLDRPLIPFTVSKPKKEEQLELWRIHLGDQAPLLNGTLERLTAQFDLSAEGIAEVSRDALLQEEFDSPDQLAYHIWQSCCRRNRPRVDELAQRIEAVAGWHNIVLPPQQVDLLKEIAAQVKQRNKVYEEWGFSEVSSRGFGISALFSGESGTGKTMAAEVLANELQLDLYRIDLSQVVNKYIGETEKNLKKIFDAAEGGGAILLFDEADALFGKRSDVKDSHDRYSNIEVSYLLQRMEDYRGLAILTTNLKNAIDKAFLRRIRFVIHFSKPDAPARADIWRRIFPERTPVGDLDYKKLAQLTVSGGNIRNIALNASFLAARDAEAVQMRHILQAARGEYQKLEKSLSRNEVAGWV